MRVRRGVVFRSAWKLASAYLFSERWRRAWGLLLSVVALNCIAVYITVRTNLWQADFYNMLQSQSRAGCMAAIGVYALLAAFLVLLRGFQTRLRLSLHLDWRAWLTETYMNLWLRGKAYYRMQLQGKAADNPDQRISEDVDLFVALTIRLFLECMQDALTVCSFIVILWRISEVVVLSLGDFTVAVHGYLVWAALLYALVGTGLTLRVGKPLIQLDYDQQRYEADFRYSLVRLREYGESIALYDGERAERRGCMTHFLRLAQNFRRIIAVRKRLTWLTDGYAHTAVVFSIFVASPPYFGGKITLGHMFQIIDAFHHVQAGLSFLIDSFTRFAQWRAVVQRLDTFLKVLERVDTQRASQLLALPEGDCLRLKALDVKRPDGATLVAGLQLSLRPGQRLLIAGPSGCGKSTLLRTIAGLWLYARGEVELPRRNACLFVPQKPYMPIGLLEEALRYPHASRQMEKAAYAQALSLCGIGYLAARLAERGDWGKILSLGEQQRLAFARILLQKPAWIFLDEATSALDDANQALVYGLLCSHLPGAAIVSVGHRKAIEAYHERKLLVDGCGGWKLMTTEH